MSFYVSVAWRNLWRHRRRTLITASAMAVAVAVVMWSIAFTEGSYAMLFEALVERQLGHVQVHHPDYPARGVLHDTLEEREALVGRVRDLPGTTLVSPSLEGVALLGGERLSTGVMLVGVRPELFTQISGFQESVRQGAWLQADQRGQIVLGAGVAEEIEVEVGDEVVALTQAADGSTGNELYTVVGLFETGDLGRDQGTAYLSLADAEALLALPDQAHGLTVLSEDADSIDAYAEGLRQVIGSEDVEVQTWWEYAPAVAEMMKMQDTAGGLLMSMIILIAAFGVINTMLMSVFERTRELGVLRALGLRPRKLVWLVVLESFFLATVAVTAGAAMGALLLLHGVYVGVDYSAIMPDGFSWQGVRFDPVMKASVRAEPIVRTVIAVFAVSMLASLWPAWRAARLRPVEALREDA